MYGKLTEEALKGSENFEQRYNGTELEGLGARLDTIVELYEEGDLSKDEVADLIEDIKREEQVEALASSIELRSDFMKGVDLLLKVL